jgi:hypothetical protein
VLAECADPPARVAQEPELSAAVAGRESGATIIKGATTAAAIADPREKNRTS